MNREEIIRMAREKFACQYGQLPVAESRIEAFFQAAYAAGAAAERERAKQIVQSMKSELEAKFEKTYMEGAMAGAAAEREACLNCYSPDDTAADWIDKIRARRQA